MAKGFGMSDGEAIFTFGKYKGCRIGEIPDDYLRWLSGTDWFEKKYAKLQVAVNEELEFREQTGGELE